MKISEITENLKKLLDNEMRLRRGKECDLSVLEDFLSEYNVYPKVKEDFRKDHGELQRLKNQNLIIDWALTYVDSHPCSEIRFIAEPIRSIIWKYAGIKCDDFSKLHIGKGVRFFNPNNITLATCGYDIFFAGLRAPAFLDGRSRIVIFGPATFGGGVKIFTHEHLLNNPNLLHWEQGRVYVPCLIYPDCFVGEDVHIFGKLEVKTVLADMTVKRPRKVLPPYSIIGGIGKDFRVIRNIDFPQAFPPKHLLEALKNVKSFSYKLGALLEKYYKLVKELSQTPGDRIENWKLIRDELTAVEKKVLEEL